jgi:hypothetical protein
MRSGTGEALRNGFEASFPFTVCVGGNGDFERVNDILMGCKRWRPELPERDETLPRRVFAASVVEGLTAKSCSLCLECEVERPRNVAQSSSVSVVVSPPSVLAEETVLGCETT